MLDFFTPTVLIACAAGSFGMGYLIINQMLLRAFMLIGSGFYIAYYATAAEAPLYGAIYTTMTMMVANVFGMATLGLRRFRIALPKAHTDIYPQFKLLNPGDFRLVMRHADRFVVQDTTDVTREGHPATHLYFVISGKMDVAKGPAQFPLPAGVFVGEVAYLLNRNSVATTTVHAGAEVVRWDIATVRRAAQRNPRFKLAVDAMLGLDLAQKVALAAPATTLLAR